MSKPKRQSSWLRKLLDKSRPLIDIDGNSPDQQSGKFGDKFVVLEIAHEGDGFDKQDAKRVNAETFIFNPSEIHGGGGTGGGTGSGLGLSLAKTIVVAHGGRLWVKSAGVGRGSVFAMGIPLGSGACEIIDLLPAEGNANSSSSRRSRRCTTELDLIKSQRSRDYERSSSKPSTSVASPIRTLESSSSRGVPLDGDKIPSDVQSGSRSPLLGNLSTKTTEELCLNPNLTGSAKPLTGTSAAKYSLNPLLTGPVKPLTGISAEKLWSSSSNAEGQCVSTIAQDILNTSRVTSPTAEKGADSTLSGLHALVVEDSKVARTMLVKLLKSLKCTTEEAEDGAMAVDMVSAIINYENDHSNDSTERQNNTFDGTEATHVFKPPSFDFILCDSVMPLMDGPTAVQKIRAMGYDKPIIGVTGNTLPEQIQDFMEHGADEIVTKPVKLAVLKETICRRCNIANFDASHHSQGSPARDRGFTPRGVGGTSPLAKTGGASLSNGKMEGI